LAEGKQAAGTMVTACTSCFNIIDKAARKQGIGLEVCDLSVLVAEAMGTKVTRF